MPFKSKAQVRKFEMLLSEGKITKEQYDQWHAETPNIKKLPERVKKKKKSGFSKGFKKVAESYFLKSPSNLLKDLGKKVETVAKPKIKGTISDRAAEIARKPCKILPEGRMAGAVERYNDGIRAKMKKVAENMADQAALEASLSMQDYAQGTSARENMETAQAKGKATRTFNVQNEDKQFNPKLKVKYDTSRFGRRNYVS